MSAHLKATLKVLISQFNLLLYLSVILLQIVIVSPGTENHESRSRTNDSQLKKNKSKIENAWVFL